MKWTNDNYYYWNGGIWGAGNGCAGFAFRLSDEAFGNLPARIIGKFAYSEIRVGDILRVNDDSHSVIVLKISSSRITIAEGNYMGKIHWGREMTKRQVMNTSDYLVTRYPCKHNYIVKKVEPTCVDPGYVEHTCRICGDSYRDQYNNTLKPHQWGELYVITEPTFTQSGWCRYRCPVCNTYRYEDMPPMERDFPFYDVPKNQWYRAAAEYAYHNGLMKGDKHRFSPMGTMTRAMVVQILYNKAGKPKVSGEMPFSDVKESDWYYRAVQWAYQNNIAAGAGGRFSPNDRVTREQFAQFLYSDAGRPKVSGSINSFPDAGQVSGWAKTAMIWANQNGIVNGKKSNGRILLDPRGNATRAEAAAMLMNYLKKK
ncbi:MAG TPA: hypothetical protein DDX51_00960 [Clostridiales bacterium]|nr:hypothetical protein [Clostridiales bacterium]